MVSPQNIPFFYNDDNPESTRKARFQVKFVNERLWVVDIARRRRRSGPKGQGLEPRQVPHRSGSRDLKGLLPPAEVCTRHVLGSLGARAQTNTNNR